LERQGARSARGTSQAASHTIARQRHKVAWNRSGNHITPFLTQRQRTARAAILVGLLLFRRQEKLLVPKNLRFVAGPALMVLNYCSEFSKSM